MAVERPLARDDLLIAPRVIGGETQYFVCDPIKNEYKQLDEMQYEVFSRLNGQRTLPELAIELKKTFDLDVSAEDLTLFVDNLGEMNLLDLAADTRVDAKEGMAIAARVKAKVAREGVIYGRRAGAAHVPRERRQRHAESALFDSALEKLDRGRIREAATYLRSVLEIAPRNYRARYLLHALLSEHIGGRQNVESIWWWRIPVGDPDRFLGRIDAIVGRFVFTRAFLVAWVLFIASAALVMAGDFDRLTHDLAGLVSLDWIFDEPIFPIVFWTLGPLSIFGHEVAHGLACKHWGGRVREMGILIAYLNPTAYCDISSTYLFQDRWRRAMVSVAGPMFTAVVWATYVYLWALVNPDTLVGRLSTVYIWLIGPSLLMELVNPLQKNDGYFALSDLLDAPNLRDEAFTYLRLRIGRLFLGPMVEIPEELHARRRLLLTYALPGIVVTSFFSGLMLWIISGYLIERFHSFGVLATAFLVYLTIGRPLRRFVSEAWRRRKELWAFPRFRVSFVGVLCATGLALAAPWPLSIEADARVAPHVESVRARRASFVDEVLVTDGQAVKAGDPVARMDSSALSAELVATSAGREQAELDLASLRQQRRDEELGVARARLYGDASVLQRDNVQVARLRALVKKGLVSQQKLDEVEAKRAETVTKVWTAQGDLNAQRATGTELEVEAAVAVVEGLQAQEAAVERQLDDTLLKSPVDGVVTLPRGLSPKEMRGLHVAEGAEVLAVRTSAAPRLELDVPIAEPVAGLVVGARARARLVGMPDRPLSGTVTKVSPAATAAATMRAEVDIDDGADGTVLPIGLTGKVRVSAGWHPVAWLLYARIVRLLEIDLQRLLA